MTKKNRNSAMLFLLKNMTSILFVVIFVGFSLLDKRFFTYQNFDNILRSSAYIGILAVGMTFVLLTGGIDLSVGAVIYLVGALLGVMLEQKINIWVSLAAAIFLGITFGAINALFIVKFKVIPFMVTLGTMTAGRGLALLFTKSRSITYPNVIKVGAVRVFGLIPVPVLIFFIVLIIGVVILNNTSLGRQIYAFGNDPEAAKKAGLNTSRVHAFAYIICGLFAALAGIVAATQQGRVNATFGKGTEFQAISAAVLGGTSFFGGIGQVFPGTFIGTLLMQMIKTGMVYLQVDGYLQDIVFASVLFFAIFVDSRRMNLLRKMEKRNIRNDEKDIGSKAKTTIITVKG